MDKRQVKLALAMIVKGSDDEAIVFKRCIEQIRPYVDGAFITITQPNKKVESIAKLFDCTISHFTWCNDFSKARNFNFSQVSKDYTHILWLDADDQVRGIEKLKDVLAEYPFVDCFSMYYLYAFDEYKNPTIVHPKTQVVANNGCVVWAGALHEDFSNTREITQHLIRGIERLHLSDDKRYSVARERNLKVAKGQLKDNPTDPRSYWNVANSYAALQNTKQAIKYFDKFIKLSKSEDEKYIANLRLAECHYMDRNFRLALDSCRFAIGLRPEFPDAYHFMGMLYFEMKNYADARDYYLMGLGKKPPYTKLMLYNPRDYDYNPLMALAKVYLMLGLPTLAIECLKACLLVVPESEYVKDLIQKMKVEVKRFDDVMTHVERIKNIKDKQEMKKALDDIPQEFQSHPALVHLRNIYFIKEESSGKDLVFYCSFTEGVWTPEIAREKGVGGSEEAVIWLSTLLARKGWNVTVYNNCGHTEQVFDGVTYKPFWSWNYRDKQDVVILWRHPKPLNYTINASKIYLDLHDVIPAEELTEERVNKLTGIFVKSNFHRNLFPNIPDDKFHIIPNGIDSKLFALDDVQRDTNLVINTSSADRSLRALIELWPEVKKQVPEARCQWAYGWSTFDYVHSDNPEVLKWKEQLIARASEVGVELLGKLSHGEIANLYKRASVFGYPTEFAEIDCISLTKAMAAGAIPVTTTFAALGEKAGHGGIFVPVDKTNKDWCSPGQYDFGISDTEIKQAWIDGVVEMLKNPPERSNMRSWAQENYDWDKVADLWQNVLQS